MAVDNFTILDGAIYAAAAGATVTVGSTQIGDFQGNVSLSAKFEKIAWRGQGLYYKDPEIVGLVATLTVSEMAFDPDQALTMLYGITSTASSLLTAAAETSTKWSINGDLDTDHTFTLLFSGTRGDTGKKIQIKLFDAQMPGLPAIVFARRTKTLYDAAIDIYADSSNNFIDIHQED